MTSLEILSQTSELKSFNTVQERKNCRLIYLKQGELTITLNDTVYKLSPLSTFLLFPEDFYYIVSEKGAVYSVINFASDEEINLKDRVFSLSDELIAELEFIFGDNELIERQTRLQLLLIALSKIKGEETDFSVRDSKIFFNAVRILNRYVTATISVDELADSLHISLSHLKRIFAKFTGIGVHEYYLMLKINKAKGLLDSGESVTRVAMLLQFSSQSYFSTTFKRVAGISAKAYSMGKNANNSEPKAKARRNITHKKPSTPVVRRSDLPDYLL